MESANLTQAHDHVRNAATATYSHSIATAGAEHELAAVAFKEAGNDTGNAEALRILTLLQDHHLKLARLIKEAPRRKERTSDAPSQASEPPIGSPPLKTSTPTSRPASPPQSSSPPPRATSRRRLPQSSIASNLAEKRGIPGARRGTSTASPVSVTNAFATRSERQPTPVQDLLQQQSKKADEANRRKEEAQAEQKELTPRDISPPPEDNFRRFYSAFGGFINAVSAPLAFTSLPLNPSAPAKNEEPESAPTSPAVSNPKMRSSSPEASRTVKTSVPDLANLISKPALRALREGQNAPLGFANNESFYFVPTSGGTVSYANILREQQAHAHPHPHHAAQDPHLDSIAEGDGDGEGLRGSSHEEFVDARETPPSPTTPRRPRSKSSSSGLTSATNIRAGTGRGIKTMEELQLENETLRSLIDKQAKRLSMWETTSQSSYNALAQSFRARGGMKQQLSDPSTLAYALSMGSNTVAPALPSPPVPPIPPQYQNNSAADADRDKDKHLARIAELEAQLATQSARLHDLETENAQATRQNDKNAQVIGRYREQWEKLKAGARKKEQERREKRVAELKAEKEAKDSESGETEGEAAGEEAMEGEEAGFGKA